MDPDSHKPMRGPQAIAPTGFAAIDFESAGSAPGRTDEPVQIAVAHLDGPRIRRVLNSYVRPKGSVTWAAKKVHGIGDEAVRDAPRLLDLWPDIRRAMHGRWIVAHGASTEKRFLRIFPFHAFGPWVDTLVLARAAYPELGSHALGDTIRALGLDTQPEISAPGFRWHDAESDAIASLVLLRHLADACDLGGSPPETLLRPDLAAYFAARGKFHSTARKIPGRIRRP
jgi:DNA polymerase-3 subunit epsilon